ncbi:MAG: VWA domain-containing protein [Prevotella sp.]|nr:VWA domain-containing protein [Prevotella sp.]
MEQNNTPIKTQVYNLVILDKSGSMECIRKEAVNGYNETLGTIKAAQLKHMDTQEHFVSLAAFCGCGIDMIYDKTPIKDAEKLSVKQYEPCCCTPLFDAVGSTIKKLKKDIEKVEDAAVLVTIITDGEENASHEWTGAAVKALIDHCKEEGWMFSFIGAGEDVIKIATKISITNTVLWEQTAKGTEDVFANENAAQTRYYDKMADACAASPCMPTEDRKKMRKKLSEEYYDKDKK